ncbi:MAG: transposase [Candidatus Competibacteraceae bacterium]
MRQAANLWRIKQLLHKRFGRGLARAPLMAISSMGSPSPSESWPAAGAQPVLKAEADYGDGAAKRAYYYGLKAHLLIDLRGVAVSVTITPTTVDEREAAYDVLQTIAGLVTGRQGL